MKKILTLILLLSFFSCDKDEPDTLSAKYSKQEIFNAVIGTWRPNRLAYDKDFKQIECMMDSPCEQKYHVTFNSDSTASVFSECLNEYEQGSFYVKKQERLKGGFDIVINYQNIDIYFSPNISHVEGITLYNYSDSTLIFSDVSYKKDGKSIDNLYSEFKRVK